MFQIMGVKALLNFDDYDCDDWTRMHYEGIRYVAAFVLERLVLFLIAEWSSPLVDI